MGLISLIRRRNGAMTLPQTQINELHGVGLHCTSNSVAYGSIQHCGVLVSDTRKSLEFYVEVFGMTDETYLRNSKLPYKGGWLRAGASQIHLMELPNPDPVSGRPEHGGRDRHLALTIGPGSLEMIQANLEKHQVPFTMSRSGRPALFTRDLDGNALEFMEEEL